MINKKRLVENFIKFCQVDAPSRKEEKLVKYLEDFFKKHKAKVHKDVHNNVLFKVGGHGEPILLNAHLDTVKSTKKLKVVKKGNILKADSKTILGGDDRAGIAMIAEVLEHFREEKIRHRPLEILFTASEEIGLIGSKNFNFSKIKSKVGFVLDEEGPISNIVIESVGYIGFEGCIIGKMAHSSEPQKGIHAIKAFTEFVQQMPFGKCTRNTMVNVGIVKGGEMVNSIADKVFTKGEIRSKDEEELALYEKTVKDCLNRVNKKYRTGDNIIFKKEFEPFKVDRSNVFLKKVLSEMEKLDLKPSLISSMGGSDANIINSNGIKVLTLAAGYYNCHSESEYVKINELLDGVRFLDKILV